VDRYDNPYSKGRLADKYDVVYKKGVVERMSNIDKHGEGWSDEESDYKWQIGLQKPTPVFDKANIEQKAEATDGKLPQRPHYDKPHKISGINYVIDKRAGQHPHEREESKQKEEDEWEDLTIPLPRVPAHITQVLGERALKTIWRYFLMNDADESEMILCENMPDVVSSTLNELCYQLPFDMIDYGELEEDDYVEYSFVVGELTKHMTVRGTENPIKEVFQHPVELPPCCALQACSRHMGIRGDQRSENFTLNVVFNRFKLKTQGNVRVDMVDQIMDAMDFAYDLEKLDAKYWHLHGQDLILTMSQLETLIGRLRTDEEEEDDDALYAVPKWLKGEFTDAEIMMFKHHFTVIDVDGGGDIDHLELMALCESLGSRITEETAQSLIDDYDLDQSGTIDFGEFLVLMFKIQSGVIDMSSDQLATALMESKAQIKIFDEIEDISANPPNEYITVSHYGQTPVVAVFMIKGPTGSIYEGVSYKLEVCFNPGYPFKIPSIRFLTRIFHINIFTQVDGTGHIRHLDALWDSRWNMYMLLEHITGLLQHSKLSYVPVHMTETVFMYMHETGVPLESLDAFDEEDQQLITTQQAALVSRDAAEAEVAIGAGEGKEEETKGEGKEEGKEEGEVGAGVSPWQETKTFGYKDHVASMPRMDQMHLNVLSMYMCEYERFYMLVRQFVDKHGVKLEEKEEDIGEVDPDYVDTSLAVDAGESYLVRSMMVPELHAGIGTSMPTVTQPVEGAGSEAVADSVPPMPEGNGNSNIPTAIKASVASSAIGTEGMMNLIGGRGRRK
jgi:ubiquitin-protein ligase